MGGLLHIKPALAQKQIDRMGDALGAGALDAGLGDSGLEMPLIKGGGTSCRSKAS